MESAANLDVLVRMDGCAVKRAQEGKELLGRIVAMLSKMTEKHSYHAREEGIDYEHDYEHEHERNSMTNDDEDDELKGGISP